MTIEAEANVGQSVNESSSHSDQLPIFSDVFENDFRQLPEVIRRHYQLRPFSEDRSRIRGHLDLTSKPPILWFSWLYRWLGNVPFENQQHVPVEVEFSSRAGEAGFHFIRRFEFLNPYQFASRITVRDDGVFQEHMKRGIVWLCRYHWRNGRVELEHVGYQLHLFGVYITLPITFLLGKGVGFEQPLNEGQFEMMAGIEHPIFGLVFSYSGRFELID